MMNMEKRVWADNEIGSNLQDIDGNCFPTKDANYDISSCILNSVGNLDFGACETNSDSGISGCSGVKHDPESPFSETDRSSENDSPANVSIDQLISAPVASGDFDLLNASDDKDILSLSSETTSNRFSSAATNLYRLSGGLYNGRSDETRGSFDSGGSDFDGNIISAGSITFEDEDFEIAAPLSLGRKNMSTDSDSPNSISSNSSSSIGFNFGSAIFTAVGSEQVPLPSDVTLSDQAVTVILSPSSSPLTSSKLTPSNSLTDVPLSSSSSASKRHPHFSGCIPLDSHLHTNNIDIGGNNLDIGAGSEDDSLDDILASDLLPALDDSIVHDTDMSDIVRADLLAAAGLTADECCSSQSSSIPSSINSINFSSPLQSTSNDAIGTTPPPNLVESPRPCFPTASTSPAPAGPTPYCIVRLASLGDNKALATLVPESTTSCYIPTAPLDAQSDDRLQLKVVEDSNGLVSSKANALIVKPQAQLQLASTAPQSVPISLVMSSSAPSATVSPPPPTAAWSSTPSVSHHTHRIHSVGPSLAIHPTPGFVSATSVTSRTTPHYQPILPAWSIKREVHSPGVAPSSGSLHTRYGASTSTTAGLANVKMLYKSSSGDTADMKPVVMSLDELRSLSRQTENQPQQQQRGTPSPPHFASSRQAQPFYTEVKLEADNSQDNKPRIENVQPILVQQQQVRQVQNARIGSGGKRNAAAAVNSRHQMTGESMPETIHNAATAFKRPRLSTTTTSLLDQPPSYIKTEKELMMWKKSQRMMKNREAAEESRRKRKEYIATLEAAVEQLVSENEELQKENSDFRAKLEELENTRMSDKWTSSFFNKNKNVVATVFTISFLLILNLTPLGLGPLLPYQPPHLSPQLPHATQNLSPVILPHSSSSHLKASSSRSSSSSSQTSVSSSLLAQPQQVPHFRSRNLMSVYDNLTAAAAGSVSGSGTYKEHHPSSPTFPDDDYSFSSWFSIDKLVNIIQNTFTSGGGRTNEVVSSALPGSRADRDRLLSTDLAIFKELQLRCPTYFNSTESQRLANDLKGWVLRHKMIIDDQLEEMRRSEKRRRHKERLAAVKQYKTPHILKAALHKDALEAYDGSSTAAIRHGRHGASAGALQVFEPHRQYSHYKFFNAIRRRNDTFYVVSFQRDQILLPATVTNKTIRPKMSLVMPALTTLNESMQPPQGQVAMMKIDCEVTDTQLIHFQQSVIPPKFRPPSSPTHSTSSPQHRNNQKQQQQRERSLSSQTATDQRRPTD